MGRAGGQICASATPCTRPMCASASCCQATGAQRRAPACGGRVALRPARARWSASARLIFGFVAEMWEGFGGHMAGETIWVGGGRIALTERVCERRLPRSRRRSTAWRLPDDLPWTSDPGRPPPSGRPSKRAGRGGVDCGRRARHAGCGGCRAPPENIKAS